MAAFYWGVGLIVSIFPQWIQQETVKEPVDLLGLFSGIIAVIVGFILWFFRRRIWFLGRRRIDFWFLVFQIIFYLAVIGAMLGPYLDFFVYGAISVFFRFGFLLTGVLLVLSFPRLPRKHTQCEQVVSPKFDRAGG